MIKKRIVLVVLVLLLCVPAQADIYSWVFGDSDAIGIRIGTDVSENVEVGLSALWWPDIEKPEIWGVYGIYHLPEIVQFPNPIALDFLPETIGGRPYFGGKVDIDSELDQGGFSFISGIVFNDILFLEYQMEAIDRNSYNESKIIFGLRISF